LTDFGTDRRNRDGRQSRCLACYRISDRVRHARPEVKARALRNRREYRKRSDFQERNRLWQARYREKFREQINARQRTPEARRLARERAYFRYHNDPNFRAAVAARNVRYLASKRGAAA
jgi:hypothetical protein